MSEEKTGKKCVCGGEIVARYRIPYLTRSPGGRNVVGPASRNIATEANKKLEGYHCDGCGIAYYKLPKT